MVDDESVLIKILGVGAQLLTDKAIHIAVFHPASRTRQWIRAHCRAFAFNQHFRRGTHERSTLITSACWAQIHHKTILVVRLINEPGGNC